MNGLPSNCIKKINTPLDETINYIYHSEFFIGLSSGMSWVAHAMGKPVAMIANFTEDWNEFDLSSSDYIRITNKSVCHGCWNKINKDIIIEVELNEFEKEAIRIIRKKDFNFFPLEIPISSKKIAKKPLKRSFVNGLIPSACLAFAK